MPHAADGKRRDGAARGVNADKKVVPDHEYRTENLGKHHAYDVGSFLDNYGIAVRTGHHCAMPLMAYYNVPAMCRASLAMYNTHEEVDRLVTGLQRIHRLLG